MSLNHLYCTACRQTGLQSCSLGGCGSLDELSLVACGDSLCGPVQADASQTLVPLAPQLTMLTVAIATAKHNSSTVYTEQQLADTSWNYAAACIFWSYFRILAKFYKLLL